MAAPFTLVSAADAYSGTTYRTLYTVPAGKQAFIKSVIGMNTSGSSMPLTLELMDNGVTPVTLSSPTVASLASTNMLAGTLVMSAGESLRQKSGSDYLKGTQVFNSSTREVAGGSFYDLIYANGLFVAVGNSAAVVTTYNNNIYTSPDGLTWTWRDVDTDTGTAQTLNSIAYGAGLFVVVGDSGFIATSPDAITWTTRTSAHGSNPIKQVIYAGGKFVAVGGSATTNSIQTSPDGITWTARTGVQNISSNYASVAYDSTNAQYVMTTGYAANGTAPSGGIQTSPDGITWTARTGSHGSGPSCTAAKPGFMLCADSNSTHTYSTDGGVTWSTLSQSLGLGTSRNRLRVIGGTFYAISSGALHTSTNGLLWTTRSCSLSNGILASNGTKFVAAYDSNRTIEDFGADLTLSSVAAFTASVVEVAA